MTKRSSKTGQAYTPGPWTDESGNGVESTGTNPPTAVAILEVDSDFWGPDYRTPAMDENAANARLIAAAPDLLAACEAAKKILATIPPDNFDGHAARALIMVRDAIAKAEGGVT